MLEKRILILVLGILLATALVSSSVSVQVPAATVTSPFVYSFNATGTLQEASSMDNSSSPYWWVNSGAKLEMKNGVGGTVAGNLLPDDKWRLLYAKNNPLDTDNGYHPQNIFRLVTRSMWGNARQQAQFYIAGDNFSMSPNRNASNGLLFFNRYQDSQTLYYAGVRVDGLAVIKKKYKGTYYTMAQKQVFPGTYGLNTNLLPHHEWMWLRTETLNNSDGSVTMRLYLQRAGTTSWTKLLEATDKGQFGGSAPIVEKGYAGIRTDFMDVKFESFRLENI